MNIVEQFEKDQIKTLIKGKKIPQFHPGDTVRVNVKVTEGTRERVQGFEGVCRAFLRFFGDIGPPDRGPGPTPYWNYTQEEPLGHKRIYRATLFAKASSCEAAPQLLRTPQLP